MLVQRSQVGSVIGRGGYKIKETREVLIESLCRDFLTACSIDGGNKNNQNTLSFWFGNCNAIYIHVVCQIFTWSDLLCDKFLFR